jgi:hypothetical protein
MSQLKQAVWSILGMQFCSDMHALSLDHFDMILGYNWLQQFSPMRVHWVAKWLVIPYGSA